MVLLEGEILFSVFFLLFFAGLFTLAASLFQWRFVFESRKAKGMRDCFGDRGWDTPQ